MTKKTTAAILIDSPLTPFSTVAEVRAWIKELDALETDVIPGSQAEKTAAEARADAEELLADAEKRGA